MQLQVKHTVEQPLCLPLNYHHMLQSIIYHHLKLETMAYSSYVHEKGFFLGNRNFKLFTFSGLQGKYQVEDKKICFYEDVMFEVRSPEPLFIRILEENLKNQGITYFGQHYNNIVTTTLDNSVENDEIKIQMITPIVVYTTDILTKKTEYYSPEQSEFSSLVIDNFRRKYTACYGVIPESDITIEPMKLCSKDKYVTKYKNFYITGWKGSYRLSGKRKYLDFLYQTGLGSKNSQGFGMFELLGDVTK